MATSPTNKSVKDDDEEVRTEETDPAKTSDEEDEVRTEEVDPAKTTEQEDEVQTEEEDEPKEKASESLVDSARDLSIGDEEFDQGTENQNRQEDPITTRRSDDQTIDRGSASLTSDQNRRFDSDPNTSAISLSSIQDNESEQGTENQNPQGESITIPRSDQTMERGSTSSARYQNQLPEVSFALLIAPYQNELSSEDEYNPSFGFPQPKWLVVDHYYYTEGFGLHSASLWGYQTITPLLPNQIPYQQDELMLMQLPRHINVTRPNRTYLVIYRQSFGHVAPVTPPMMQQNLIVPHLVRGQAPTGPVMQQYLLPGQAPTRPMMQQDQFMTYLRPGQALTRPVMQHDQVVPYNLLIGQAPVRPVLYNQDQIVLNQGQLAAPLMQPPVMMYSPSPIVNAVPLRPMMNYNNQPQFNQGQQGFRYPVNMIQHQLPSPNAAAEVPRPEEVNQQRQPRTQQPSQSQGSNDGPSSSG